MDRVVFGQRPRARGGKIRGAKGYILLLEPTDTKKYRVGQVVDVQDKRMGDQYRVQIVRVDAVHGTAQFVTKKKLGFGE